MVGLAPQTLSHPLHVGLQIFGQFVVQHQVDMLQHGALQTEVRLNSHTAFTCGCWVSTVNSFCSLAAEIPGIMNPPMIFSAGESSAIFENNQNSCHRVGSDCIGSGTVAGVTGQIAILNHQHPDLTVIEPS